jgi:hypothetical protein
MGPRLGLVAISLLVLASSGCGGGDGPATTSQVALQPCTRSDGGSSGYGWDAEVNGLSCDEAGRFIRREIFPRAGEIAHRSHVQAGAYACSVAELSHQVGWKVACERHDQRLEFNWTP